MNLIAPLDHRDPAVALALHRLLVLAHAQELAHEVGHGVDHTAPTARTALDVQACDEHFLGALCAGELVGAISLRADDEPGQILVASLLVHPGHQRQGIARALMLAALGRGQGAPFGVVVAASNAPALALYLALGFVAYRRGSLGPAEVAMLKLRRVGPPPADGGAAG